MGLAYSGLTGFEGRFFRYTEMGVDLSLTLIVLGLLLIFPLGNFATPVYSIFLSMKLSFYGIF